MVSVVLAMPVAETRKAAEDAARAVPRAWLVDSGNWHVTVRVALSWKSFGEEVRVDFHGEETGTHVRVTSRLLRPALEDYGKNQANVDSVLAALKTADERYRSGRGTSGGHSE